MPTQTRRPPVSETLPRSLDGYDFAAETARAATMIPEVEIAGHRLSRATARVAVSPEPAEWEEARRAHRDAVFPNTLDSDSPVLELGWPTSGHYVRSSRGVELDLVLGVAQKLIDERHPAIARAVARLAELGLLTRREINTDDYLRAAPHATGVHTPQDLAALLDGAAAAAYPGTGAWRTFFANSGTEAVEACMKLAFEVRYKRLLEAHGAGVLAQVMAELGIHEFRPLAVDTSRPEPVYEDYPFFLVGCQDAFHGRTLGSLSLTASKKSQKVGHPRLRWIRHIPLNAAGGTLASLLDARPLPEILSTAGELRRVVDAGRIPADLFAGFLVEPFQGEGGYVAATHAFLRDCEAACRSVGALFMLDEVQTFGRTGSVFLGEQAGVQPDAIAVAKGVFVGAMIARADYSRHLHNGWHSNTWGGGKVFDNQVAYAVLDTVLNERSELFQGRSLVENVKLKARLIEAGLAELAARHADLVTAHTTMGCLARITVRRRADFVRAAWRRGLKLLACGRAADAAPVRLIFLTDVLAREILEGMDLLDLALSDVA